MGRSLDQKTLSSQPGNAPEALAYPTHQVREAVRPAMGSTLPLTLFQSWETEQAPEGPISRASGREPKPEALAGADFTGPGGVFPERASGMLLPVRAKLGSVPTKAGCNNSVKRESPDAKEPKKTT